MYKQAACSLLCLSRALIRQKTLLVLVNGLKGRNLIKSECRTLQFYKVLKCPREERLIKHDGLLFGARHQYNIYKRQAKGLMFNHRLNIKQNNLEQGTSSLEVHVDHLPDFLIIPVTLYPRYNHKHARTRTYHWCDWFHWVSHPD